MASGPVGCHGTRLTSLWHPLGVTGCGCRVRPSFSSPQSRHAPVFTQPYPTIYGGLPAPPRGAWLTCPKWTTYIYFFCCAPKKLELPPLPPVRRLLNASIIHCLMPLSSVLGLAHVIARFTAPHRSRPTPLSDHTYFPCATIFAAPAACDTVDPHLLSVVGAPSTPRGPSLAIYLRKQHCSCTHIWPLAPASSAHDLPI